MCQCEWKWAWYYKLKHTQEMFPDARYNYMWSQYDRWATAPSIHVYMANSVQYAILYIFWTYLSQNYDHLKYTRPVTGKSKVVSQESRCGVCVGVSRNTNGCVRKWVERMIVCPCLFSSYMYMQPCFQTSHFENYPSAWYANVATAIHINWKVWVLHVGINRWCIYTIILFSPWITHTVKAGC